MCDTYLKPQAMKYFTSHNLLLEAAPTVFPKSCSRQHICSSHKTVTQPLSLPTEKQIYTHQHYCSCNLVPFLEPLAAVSASSSLYESSPAQHFLTARETVSLPLRCASSMAWASMPAGHQHPHESTRLPYSALVLWTAGSCSSGAGVTLLGPEPLQEKGSGTRDNGPFSTTSFALQALSCSQPFTAVPTANIQAASHRCGRECPSTKECFFQ